MRVILVSGLLGSGKTTFIKNVLRDGWEDAVVLVNDFAEAGVDGQVFETEGIRAVELPNGCVCCSLRQDLGAAVAEIEKRYAPRLLVIEPSGVAAPSGVLEALSAIGIKDVTVVGVLDACEFAALWLEDFYGPFFADQVERSDIILLNKADLAEGADIARAEEIVSRVNPHAVIFRTVNARPDADLSGLSPAAGKKPSVRRSPGLRFESVTVRLPGEVSYEKVLQRFEALASGVYGDVVRAKALVQTERGPFRLDVSFGRRYVSAFGAPVIGGRLVVIGSRLDKEGIERAFQAG